MDGLNLVCDVIDRASALAARAGHVRQAMTAQLTEHKIYIAPHGKDVSAIDHWVWLRQNPK